MDEKQELAAKLEASMNGWMKGASLYQRLREEHPELPEEVWKVRPPVQEAPIMNRSVFL